MCIRLLLAAEQPAMWDAIRTAFLDSGIQIVAETSTSEETVLLATTGDVDVVLLDTAGGECYQTLRHIKAALPALPVVVLCDQDHRELSIQSFALGASGHVAKAKGPRRLVESVQEVFAFRMQAIC